MADRKETPFVCHVFVCTNDRQGARKSCADGASPALRAALKKAVGIGMERSGSRVAERLSRRLRAGAECDDLSAEDLVLGNAARRLRHHPRRDRAMP